MFTERKSYTNEFFHKILSLFTFLGNRSNVANTIEELFCYQVLIVSVVAV